MAADTPIKTQGTKVFLCSEDADETAVGAATFLQVGQIQTIGEPSGEADDIETTHLDSEAKEFMTGLPDNGNIQFSMNALSGDPGHDLAIAAQADGLRRWLKIQWSNGDIWTIKAAVKKYTWGGGVNQKVAANLSLRLSGGWNR